MAVVVLLAGCARQQEVAPPPQLPDAGAQTDAGYAVLPGKLDRFIRYQEQSLALYSKMFEELEKGSGADAGVAASVARIREHALAEARLRESLGLSDGDVRALEQIVGDVVARRAAAAALRTEEDPVAKLKVLAAKMPGEQRAEFQATLAALELQRQAAGSLVEERRKYGDANVDLILTREAQLTAQWNQAISAFARGPGPAR